MPKLRRFTYGRISEGLRSHRFKFIVLKIYFKFAQIKLFSMDESQLRILAIVTRGLPAGGEALIIAMHLRSVDDLLASMSTCENPQILRIFTFKAPEETLHYLLANFKLSN